MNRTGFKIIGIPNVSISFKLNGTVKIESFAIFFILVLRKNNSKAISTQIVVPQPPITTYTSKKLLLKITPVSPIEKVDVAIGSRI